MRDQTTDIVLGSRRDLLIERPQAPSFKPLLQDADRVPRSLWKMCGPVSGSCIPITLMRNRAGAGAGSRLTRRRGSQRICHAGGSITRTSATKVSRPDAMSLTCAGQGELRAQITSLQLSREARTRTFTASPMALPDRLRGQASSFAP
jgi:hypothetical protein